MKRTLKSTTIVLLFLIGTAFFFPNHGDKLAGPSAVSDNNPKMIATERERAMMMGLSTNNARKKALPVGLWGGEHISIEVTDQGATVEYDCAHAAIDQRIILDRRGRFDVSGMQVQERGGPVRQNDELAGYPVRFTGQVNGKRMKLSVRNTATKELIGTFTLVYRAQPKLRKCR